MTYCNLDNFSGFYDFIGNSYIETKSLKKGMFGLDEKLAYQVYPILEKNSSITLQT